MLVVHPPFVPCRDRLTFLCLPKKSKQKKGAPEMATSPWICVAGREGRQTRCAQTGLPSLSFPQQKSKAPSRTGTSKAKPLVCVFCRCLVCCCVLLRCARTPPMILFCLPCFAACRTRTYCVCSSMVWPYPALDGALNLRKRAEKRRETV